jgi:hypothetical protein
VTESARLPSGAPESVRSFVECRSDRLEFAVHDLGWLATSGFQPQIRLLAGSTPTTAPLRITWDEAGFLATDLRLTIVSGRLSVDTSDLPTLLRPNVDRWIADFNRTLTDHAKELDSLRAERDRITVTKRDTPPHGANAGGVAAIAALGSRSSSRTRAPSSPPSPTPATPRKLVAAVVVVALVLLGGLGVWASRRSSDEAVSTAAPIPVGEQDVGSPLNGVPEDESTAETDDQQIADQQIADPPQPTPTPSVVVCGAPQTGIDDFRSGSWDSIDGLQACQQLPPGGAFTCDSTVLPCPGTAPWLLRASGVVGVSHAGSVPDAVTGEVGPSQAEHLVQAIAPSGADVTQARISVTDECGGEQLTGRSSLMLDGPTPVAHPLFSFGPCRTIGGTVELADGVEIDLPGAMFGTNGEFVVDSAMVAAELVIGNGNVFDDPRFVFGSDWSDAALTTLGVLAAAPLDGRCVRLAEPVDVASTAGVLDSCRSAGAGWVLASGFTPDPSIPERFTPIAHGAGFVNPGGRPDSAAVDFDGFDTTRPLFDQTIFPCGIGHVGITVCPPDLDGPVAAGSLIAVTVVFDGDLPGAGADRVVTVDFALSGGPSWTIGGDRSGWTIVSDSGATNARAVIRNNSLTLLVPHRELPDGALRYILRTGDGETTLDQPFASVHGTITTPTVLPVAPPSEPPPSTLPEAVETIPDFYEQFSASIRDGDTAFLLERLHPVVDEAYPDLCQATLESFVDPDFDVSLESIGATGTWEWSLPDGRSFPVADATTVTIALTGRGQLGTPSESHLVLIDGVYRWFTFCV